VRFLILFFVALCAVEGAAIVVLKISGKLTIALARIRLVRSQSVGVAVFGVLPLNPVQGIVHGFAPGSKTPEIHEAPSYPGDYPTGFKAEDDLSDGLVGGQPGTLDMDFIHRISGAGRFESARLRAQNPFNEAPRSLTRTRSNGILSRRGLGFFPACHAGPGWLGLSMFTNSIADLASVVLSSANQFTSPRFRPKSTAHPSPSTTPLQEWTNV